MLSATALFLFSCSNTNTSSKNTGSSDTANNAVNPVETSRLNSNYKPAFPGQTRVAGVTSTTPWEGTVINTTLKHPWGITSLPDGRLLITEKEGTMRIATSTGQLSQAITGIPPVNSGGQGGLLGVTIDPQFATNKMVYWVFSESTQGGNLTAVAKGSYPLMNNG